MMCLTMARRSRLPPRTLPRRGNAADSSLSMQLFLVRSIALLISMTVAATAAAQEPAPMVPQPMAPLPPATKLEAFAPAVGSVLTIGYDELGRVEGISVDVRDMHDGQGASVRGLVVRVAENERHEEISYVDEDELSDLLKGFDALLEVRGNPTAFKNFEVRYATRGELELTVFNAPSGVLFAVRAGRLVTARRSGLSVAEMLRLRNMFATAAQKLSDTPVAR